MSAAPGITVDIVVNNFNYGGYVCEAVDSALAQSHPHVHVIIVDDGSTDDSRTRLQAYEGRAELVFKDNGGQPSAFNAGFARCSGDVVIFLDADDVLAAGVAAWVAAALDRQPLASRVQFRMALIDAQGRPLGSTRPPIDREMPSGDQRFAELAFPFDLCWAPGGGNAYSTAALKQIMPIPAGAYGRWGADYYLVHLTALLGHVLVLGEVGASYRVHGANAFEPAAPVLDFERVRREIRYQQATLDALSRLATQLGLEPPERILSMSNLALRMISHKLAPDLHPVDGDRSSALLADAIRAARRRYDVSLATRLALLAVLSAIAAAPRSIASMLAELLVFPELRPRLTRRVMSGSERTTVVRGTGMGV